MWFDRLVGPMTWPLPGRSGNGASFPFGNSTTSIEVGGEHT